MINKFPIEFEEALPILRKIEESGFEAYFVGGSVRDTILGREIHDVDIATSAYPEEVKQIFKRTVDTGIQHGTVMVLDHGKGYEVTTFRTESTYQDYRRPDEVTFVRSLVEDLKRRDFTINALALSESGEVTDLFSGLDDMKNHLIRAVGIADERFNEDALRMMRAIRFSSQLDFNIESETERAIYRHSHLLEKIAIERVHEEFIKMMMGMRPNLGLTKMVETQLSEHMPNLSGKQAILKQLSELHLNEMSEIEIWALLAFSFKYNKEDATKFMHEWKSSNQLTEEVIKTTTLLNDIQAGTIDNFKLYLAGQTAVISADHLAYILKLGTKSEELITQYNNLQIKTRRELAISAKELIANEILTPGPELGHVLNKLETIVVNNQLDNNYDELLSAAKSIKNEGIN